MKLGRDYARLWSASTLSGLGGGIGGTALPLLASGLTRNPTLIAGVSVAAELPWLLFGLPAGAIVDRVDRRRLMVTAGALNLCLTSILIAAIAGGWVTIPLIYAVTFACAIGGTAVGTARLTMAPMLVAPHDLDRANSRLVSATSAGAEFIGPPAGSFLFGILDVMPFVVRTVLAAVATSLIYALPDRFKAPESVGRRSIGDDIREGAGWLLRHRRLRAITALSALLALTDSAWFAIMVLYVRDALGLPASAYGILVGIGAIGGLAGGLTAAGLSRRIGTTRCLIGGLLTAALGQAILGVTHSAIVSVVALSMSSFVFGVWDVVTTTLRQTLTPAALLGRVTSTERTAIMAASPIGALLGGITASTMGIRAPFLLGLPILLLGTAAGYHALTVAVVANGESS